MRLRRLLPDSVGIGGVLAFAVGCTGSVEVSATDPGSVVTDQCQQLIAHLPDHVAGQSARAVQPADALVAAWGDPPIVLRCGVTRPPSLRRVSGCFVVNDVGWLAEQDGRPVDGTESIDGAVVFTTIGRSAYVEVTVPPDYQPAADALVDVAGAVNAATKDLRPCV